MSKAYVKDWKERPPESSRGHTFYDVTFEYTSEGAKRVLETREQAEAICREFGEIDVEVPSGKCKCFGVEQRAPDQFVIFCEYPPEGPSHESRIPAGRK
jgi:hypothetical protein